MMSCVSRSVDEPKPAGRALQWLVDFVAAGSRVIDVHVLAGSFSHNSCRVELEAADGTRSRIVTRRYADHGEPPFRKAIREFEALGLLCGHPEVPTPEPLLDGRDPDDHHRHPGGDG